MSGYERSRGTPITSQFNYLSKLLTPHSDLNDVRNPKWKSGNTHGEIETSSKDSNAAAEMESYAWIDRMWKKYTAEGLSK